MKKMLSRMTAGLVGSILVCVSVATVGAAKQGAVGTSLYTASTFAGNGEFKVANGEALASMFRSPQGLAVLKDGSVIVADTKNHLLRQIKDGKVSTFAGVTFDTDDLGLPLGGMVNGKKDKAVFQSPADIEIDAIGNLYVADAENNVIRKINLQADVTVLAGDADGVPGNVDGSGTAAKFYHPADIAVTPAGTIYVADTLNHTIRMIAANGTVTTLNSASTRTVEVTDGQIVFAGDFKDGKLNEALFNEPSGLALDAKGNLYVSDSGNQRIRYIDFAAGTVSTVSGAKEVAYPEDALYAVGDYVDGPAASAKFDFPRGMALTAEGGLLIADSSNNAIRYLFDGKVSTIVGTLNADFGDTDGSEKSALLHHPTDVAVAANGDIYVADAYNNKIRKIAAYRLPAGLKKDGRIQVVIGDKITAFDAKPQKVNGRVMVPVRAIAESLGYEVKASDNVKIVLAKGTTTVEFLIGSPDAKKTVGTATETSKIDAAPYIKDNRAYVPVRFVSEQLGKQVDWNQEYQTVIIR